MASNLNRRLGRGDVTSRLTDLPVPDKAVAGIGAGVSVLLAAEKVEVVLALIIAAMTIVLLGLRIALAIRDWRRGKVRSDDK